MTSLDSIRSLVRDTDQVVFTDDDLQVALDSAGGVDILRAAGIAIQSLAIEYATTGKSVKTADLAIDLRQRGTDLLAVARSFFDEALAVQEIAADNYVSVAEPGGRTHDWESGGIWVPWGNPTGWEWRI